MQQYERYGLWAVVALLVIFTAVNFSSVNGLEDSVKGHSQKLSQPRVMANIVPGVPSDLKETWKKATQEKKVSFRDNLWLTARLTNRGFGNAGLATTRLSTVEPIRAIYVYSAQGEALGGSYGGPEVKEGGAGDKMAAVDLDGIPSGEAGVVFVGFQPKGYGEPPYGPDDQRRWANEHQLYWNSVQVTSAESGFTDQKIKVVEYGLGSAGAPMRAEEPSASGTSG